MTSSPKDTSKAFHYDEECCGRRKSKRYRHSVCKKVLSWQRNRRLRNPPTPYPLESKREIPAHLVSHEHQAVTRGRNQKYSSVNIYHPKAPCNDDHNYAQKMNFSASKAAHFLSSLPEGLNPLDSEKHLDCNHDELLMKYLSAKDNQTRKEVSAYAENENIILKKELRTIMEENKNRKQSIVQLTERLGDLLDMIDSGGSILV